jgi:integrative and conjugative element protein (TIGR02256 family)
VHESHPTPLVWLTHSASVSIVAEVVRAGALETGGLLVGYWSGEADVVVTDATRPGPLAAHAEDTYVPDADHDELAMARLYAASGRRHAYLGDWRWGGFERARPENIANNRHIGSGASSGTADGHCRSLAIRADNRFLETLPSDDTESGVVPSAQPGF